MDVAASCATAGMGENVKRGFRAGGRAPAGYKLKHEPTGAYRDGHPVMKSKLETDETARAVGAYMKLRAAGVPRRSAALQSRIGLPDTTLIGMEWNALTYAGCTVWNVHNERIRGRAVGGTKRRPRSEWIIKEGTHEAFITRAEAEALLRTLEAKALNRRDRAPEDYILGGLVETPAGEPWHGCRDGAWRSYRLGRGRRVNAQAVEHAVVEKIAEDLKSPQFVKALVRAARELARPDPELQAIGRAYADMEALDRKIAKITELLPEGPQRPLLEQIRRFEERREKIRADVIDHETRLKQARAIAGIKERDVVAILDNLANDLATLDTGQLREFVRSIVARIVMDARDLTCRIHYEIPAVSGDKLASPRGFEPRLPP